LRVFTPWIPASRQIVFVLESQAEGIPEVASLAAVSFERSIAAIGAEIVGAAVGLALGCGPNQ
jgi:hypothetical protein